MLDLARDGGRRGGEAGQHPCLTESEGCLEVVVVVVGGGNKRGSREAEVKLLIKLRLV